MRRLLYAAVCILLITSLALPLSGCSSSAAGLDLAESKTAEFLDFYKAGDIDSAYALFYPGNLSSEDFLAFIATVKEYFPLSGDYTITRIGGDWHNFFGSERYTSAGVTLKIESEALPPYYITATYRTDSEKSGFIGFNVLNSADYETVQRMNSNSK